MLAGVYVKVPIKNVPSSFVLHDLLSSLNEKKAPQVTF